MIKRKKKRMAKSGFIGSILIIAFLFLAITIYSVFSYLDQASTVPWSKRLIWLWFGFSIIIGCYIIMVLLIIRWFNALCKFKFIVNSHDSTQESIVHYHTSQGISINTFRNPRFILDVTTNTGNIDYKRIPLSDIPIAPEDIKPHTSYVYLLKPFVDIRKELMIKDETEEELITDFEHILKPPDIVNPLLYVSIGGLLWAIIAWGLLLTFSILLTIKLDDGYLTWRIIFIPIYCFLGLPVALWIIAFIHPRRMASRYKWYMIGWLYDLAKSKKTSHYTRYIFAVALYICASVISISFLIQYLDDPLSNTDFLYGTFLPQVIFFGTLFGWLFFWIIIPKIIEPTSRTRYPFHIVFFLLISSGLATTFFSLLWIRVQWTTFAWSWLLIPFISLCGFIIFSILYIIMNYMSFIEHMDMAMNDYLLGHIPIQHMPKDISQTNITGSEPLLPDITTDKKETL